MTRIVFTVILVLSSATFCLSQEQTVFRINPLKADTEQLTRHIYRYKDFHAGRVYFNDSTMAEARMNYHLLFGQILFLTPRGDTLALANPAMTRLITISADSFYYHDKSFLQILTQYPGNNLAVKETIKFVGHEKAGPYGTYSSVSSANSNSTVTVDDQITQYIGLDENTVFTYKHEYYLADRFNNFFRASKKGFFNLFSRHEKSLKAYLKNNPVDYNKGKDLLRLIEFANGLNK